MTLQEKVQALVNKYTTIEKATCYVGNLRKEVLSTTSFLDDLKPFLFHRLYAILNNIQKENISLCLVCQKERVHFLHNKPGLSKTCLSISCRNKYAHSFSSCHDSVSREKAKDTMLDKYGVENVMQLNIFKQKVKDTMLDKYGVAYTMQSKELLQKSKETLLKNYGVAHSLQNKELLKKSQETVTKNYGSFKEAYDCSETVKKIYHVNNISQFEEIKQKKINTMQQNFGVDHHLQLKEQQDKQKQTVQENYGKDNVSQVKEVHDKKVKSYQEHYNVDNIFQDIKFIKQSYIKHFGVENPSQVDWIKEKKVATTQEHYGVDHHMQDPETCDRILKLSNKNMSKWKEFILPNNERIFLQGNEPNILSYLLEYIDLSDILTHKEIEPIWYLDTIAKKRRYFPDLKRVSTNTIIEVKSTYTLMLEEYLLEKVEGVLQSKQNIHIYIVSDKIIYLLYKEDDSWFLTNIQKTNKKIENEIIYTLQQKGFLNVIIKGRQHD